MDDMESDIEILNHFIHGVEQVIDISSTESYLTSETLTDSTDTSKDEGQFEDQPISISSTDTYVTSETLSQSSDTSMSSENGSIEKSLATDISFGEKIEDTTLPDEDKIAPEMDTPEEMTITTETLEATIISSHAVLQKSVKEELDQKFDENFFHKLQNNQLSKDEREDYFRFYGCDLTYITDESTDDASNQNQSSSAEKVENSKIPKVFLEKLSSAIIHAHTSKPKVYLKRLDPKFLKALNPMDLPDPYLNPQPSTSGLRSRKYEKKQDTITGSHCCGSNLTTQNAENSDSDTDSND